MIDLEIADGPAAGEREKRRHVGAVEMRSHLAQGDFRRIVPPPRHMRCPQPVTNARKVVACQGLERDTRVGLVGDAQIRSEEHTSELPSLMRISYAAFCLKKKKIKEIIDTLSMMTERTKLKTITYSGGHAKTTVYK